MLICSEDINSWNYFSAINPSIVYSTFYRNFHKWMADNTKKGISRNHKYPIYFHFSPCLLLYSLLFPFFLNPKLKTNILRILFFAFPFWIEFLFDQALIVFKLTYLLFIISNLNFLNYILLNLIICIYYNNSYIKN